jgi:hypothetical protein
MKKTIVLLFTLSILTVTAIAVISRKSSNNRIAVAPNGREIPTKWGPLNQHLSQETIDQKGYEEAWIDLDQVPKRHQYFKRLKNFILNKNGAKAVVFHNYHPFFSKAKIDQLPRGNRILVMWEPPSVLLEMYSEEILSLFDKVYTWNDDLVDGKKFFKMNYNVLRPMEEKLPSFEERKLLCMVASNLKFNNFEEELYSTRRKIARFFEDYPEGTFDLYGRLWEGYRHAKGTIPNKLDKLKEYKFNICFENTKQPGYITEKIFDCFVTGTVPIYYGATNVDKYIPKGCYIDYRQFKNEKEMLEYIQKMSKEEYEEYVSNIRAYLKSEQAEQFSSETFAKTLIDAIEN